MSTREWIPSENIAEELVKKAAVNLLTAIAVFATIAPYIAFFDDPAMIVSALLL